MAKKNMKKTLKIMNNDGLLMKKPWENHEQWENH